MITEPVAATVGLSGHQSHVNLTFIMFDEIKVIKKVATKKCYGWFTCSCHSHS